MVCKKCGKEIQDGIKFCPECGTEINGAGEVTQDKEVKQPKKKKKGCLVVILSVLVVLILLVVIAGGSGDGSDSSSTETQQVSGKSDDSKGQQETTQAGDTKESFISSCERVSYEDVSRNPENYENKRLAVEGKVIQVSESSSNKVVYRISEENSYSGKTWYVVYKRSDGESRILEDDYVTAYGTCDGLESYTSITGSTVTIPRLTAEYIDLGKVVNGQTVVFDSQEIAEKLEATEYRIDGEYFNYYCLSVKNTSEYEVSVSVNVNFYDSENKLVGAKSTSIDVLAPEMEGFAYVMPDNDYDHAEYELSVSQSDFYTDGRGLLSYETSDTADKVIVTMTNNGDEAVSFAQADILFFDENGNPTHHDNTYFTDDDSEIKPGKSINKELSCYEGFSSYKIWVSGKISAY